MAAAPLRVLVCPQEFKGSLDAFEATASLARGVRAALSDRSIEVLEQPMADGGPGTAAILGRALGAEPRRATVRGSYGAEVEATYLVARTPDGPLAIIESASATGLTLTPPDQRDPAFSSTEGVGDLLLRAAAEGARRAILCVGGTATMDGGSGVARRLGLRLLDRNGDDLPAGGLHLARLARIEATQGTPDLEVRIAVDARNPLTGPEGAVAVYGSQKGLPEWQAPALDAAIAGWARMVREHLGRDIDVPGAGTGGGITAGVLAALPRARIESGAALVAESVGLRDLIARADLVVTGEGALDAQTAYGKTVGHVLELAREADVPCLAVAGVIREQPAGLADAEPLAPDPDDHEAVRRAIEDAAEHASAAAERVVRRWAER